MTQVQTTEFKGIKRTIQGNKMILEIDLSANHGPSSTGKTDIIGTTEGFVKLDGDHDGVSMTVMVCKKRPKA